MTTLLFHRFVLPLFIGVLGVNMSACSTTSWREEVLLHNGDKVIVERSVTRHGRHELGQRPPIGEQNLLFHLPEPGKSVGWKDEFSEELGSANFLPMLFDIYEGTPYLIVSPMGCLSYNKWGRPNPPYVVFQYQDQDWRRVHLPEVPDVFKTPNLIISSPDDAAKQAGIGVIRADKVMEINKGFRQPKYQTILREPYPRAAGGCIEMIRVNDGWEGLGFFKRQSSYEACLKYCDRKGVDQQNCPCETLFERK